MTMNKTIGLLTSVLVLALAVAAFVLSYDALRGLAADNGVKAKLAWIWPFVIDGFLIVASLSVLRNGLLGERALYQWALVVLFTAASIAFNIAHAPENLLARVVGATPPIALALAFELLMGQLKSDVKRGQAVKSLAALTEDVNEKRQKLSALTSAADDKRQEISRLTSAADEKRQEHSHLSSAIDEKRQRLTKLARQLDAVDDGDVSEIDVEDVSTAVLNKARLTRESDAQAAIDALLTFYTNHPDATQAEAGDAVDRSRSWVSMRLSELEEEGIIRRNGGGVLVEVE